MDSVKISKFQQIVRLRQMLHRWQKLAARRKAGFINTRLLRHLGRSASFSSGEAVEPAGTPAAPPPPTPAGHVAVYVGPERRRFLVRTCQLSHPVLAAVLRKTQEEFGYQHAGPLAIPCLDPTFFQHLLWVVQASSQPSAARPRGAPPAVDEQHLLELLDLYFRSNSTSTPPAGAACHCSCRSCHVSSDPACSCCHVSPGAPHPCHISSSGPTGCHVSSSASVGSSSVSPASA